jgi:hypothetical protein
MSAFYITRVKQKIAPLAPLIL